MPGIVREFMEALRDRTFSIEESRRLFEELKPQMAAEEIARCTVLLSRWEADIKRSEARQPKLRKLLSDWGWIGDYLKYVENTEAPDSFHFFSIAAVASHMLGRQVYMDMPGRRIIPPLSVFLVSPAGMARRSTAMRTAANIGALAGATILQDATTPEGLIDWLQSMPETLILADEAASLISRVEYMNALPQMLCTLLDCPERFMRKLRRDIVVVERPTVNLLMGCAPEWIVTSMPKSAVMGGLFSRMLIVYESGRKKLVPLADGWDKDAQTYLATELRKTTDILGERRLELSEEARDLYVSIYFDIDQQMSAASEKMRIYLSRKADHLCRLTMILHIMKGEQSDIVDVETFRTAALVLQTIEPKMEIAYRQAGLELPGRLKARIMSAIGAGGEVEHSQLLRRVSDMMNARTFKETIQSLVEEDMIEVKPVRRGNRIVKVYRMKG